MQTNISKQFSHSNKKQTQKSNELCHFQFPGGGYPLTYNDELYKQLNISTVKFELCDHFNMNFWFILKLQQSDFGRMFLTFSGYNNILAPYSKLDDFISHPPQCPCHPHKKLGVLSLPIPSLALLNVVLNMYTPPS